MKLCVLVFRLGCTFHAETQLWKKMLRVVTSIFECYKVRLRIKVSLSYTVQINFILVGLHTLDWGSNTCSEVLWCCEYHIDVVYGLIRMSCQTRERLWILEQWINTHTHATHTLLPSPFRPVQRDFFYFFSHQICSLNYDLHVFICSNRVCNIKNLKNEQIFDTV